MLAESFISIARYGLGRISKTGGAKVTGRGKMCWDSFACRNHGGALLRIQCMLQCPTRLPHHILPCSVCVTELSGYLIFAFPTTFSFVDRNFCAFGIFLYLYSQTSCSGAPWPREGLRTLFCDRTGVRYRQYQTSRDKYRSCHGAKRRRSPRSQYISPNHHHSHNHTHLREGWGKIFS